MKLQVLYNPNKGNKIVGYSKSTKLNIGSIEKAKLITITTEEYTKIKSNDYEMKLKGGIVVFAENSRKLNRDTTTRLQEFKEKFDNKTITQEEKDGLLMVLLKDKLQ